MNVVEFFFSVFMASIMKGIYTRNVFIFDKFRLNQFIEWRNNGLQHAMPNSRLGTFYRSECFPLKLAQLAIWLYKNCDKSPIDGRWIAPAGLSRRFVNFYKI